MMHTLLLIPLLLPALKGMEAMLMMKVHSVYIVQEESSPLCKDRVLSKTKLRRVQGCVEMGTKKYD